MWVIVILYAFILFACLAYRKRHLTEKTKEMLRYIHIVSGNLLLLLGARHGVILFASAPLMMKVSGVFAFVLLLVQFETWICSCKKTGIFLRHIHRGTAVFTALFIMIHFVAFLFD